jgi:hypothetical protein
VTATDRPAIVSVPERAVVPVYAGTAYVTVPLPLPLAPDVMLIQLRLSVAVHEQPLVVVTVTVAVMPPAAIDCEVGETE